MAPVTEHSDLFVMNADGSGLTNVTNDSASFNRDPAWSPAGHAIAFQSAGLSGFSDLYRVNADGSGRLNLTNTDHLHESGPAWSPDGRRVAYQASGDAANQGLYVMNANGSDQTNLTAGDASRNRQPAWSPNGDKIAFASNRGGNDDIYVMDPDGGSVTRLTNDAAQDSVPAWSPDGTKLVFQSDRDGPLALYVMDAGGGQVQPLASERGGALPDWQPLAGDFARVTVAKELVPASDPGRFILALGSTVLVRAAGDGDFGTTSVTPGTYVASEDSDVFTLLQNYDRSVSCTRNGSPYVTPAGPGFIDVAAGDHVVCTITNIRILGDSDPPVLALPADKTVDATSASGATVTYVVSVSDTTDPNPTVNCTPASGSVFPIGATPVRCTAADNGGNSATGSFTVTVRSPTAQLAELFRQVIITSRLPSAVKAQLLARLQPLVNAFDPSNPAQRRLVCNGLSTFSSLVRVLSGIAIPPGQAAAWIVDANRIRAVIGC